MAGVAVENPMNATPPHKRYLPSNIPSIDIEGIGNDDSDEYSNLKKLQRHLEYVTSTFARKDAILSHGLGTSTSKKNISRMSRGSTSDEHQLNAGL